MYGIRWQLAHYTIVSKTGNMDANELSKSNPEIASLIEFVKSGLSEIPVLAQFIDAFSAYEQIVQTNNIIDVLKTHGMQIEILMAMAKDSVRISSPSYPSDVMLTVQKAKDELNENKRRLYASYLTACCHTENENDTNKSIYLDYVGRLDFYDFFILKSLSNLYNGKDAVDFCTSSYNLHYKGDITTTDTKIHLDHLTSLGLIERSDKEEVDKFNQMVGNRQPRQKIFKKLNLYQRTSLGCALYNFIKKGILE